LPPEHLSQNGIFYSKIVPIIGLGYLKVVIVANIVFVEKCRMISQVSNMNGILSITSIVAPRRQQN
jgi:hypothetical protein